ncbi:hypothetical protein [Reichenbachiella ulvae]|uniref:ATP-binding protein n=1 Tax=Reichenbachiella ulvae TaxID=2980104 RepID=A0ABT3CRR2_9BACT|nr:hypothetical protein [Reichenbachiella ulvae]MCV9386390.1 hypothetical protein [Reichenbachiella ulvae]
MKNIIYLSIILLLGIACQQKPKADSETIENTEAEEVFESPTLSKLWESDTVLTTAEAVIYHPELDILFVSCINGTPPDSLDNDGFISQISPVNGEIINLKWVEGISAPKGMGILGNSLFVSNINEVVEIDITSAEIINRYPVEGAAFLNDITIAEDSTVLISDSGTNKIIAIKEGEASTYLENADLKGPNGLLFRDGSIYTASFGGGDFMEIDYLTKELTVLTDSIMSGDGVMPVGEDFLVSSWPGEVYYVTSDGSKTLLSDTKADNISAADIWYLEDKNMLLVPTFFANSVVAYQLK